MPRMEAQSVPMRLVQYFESPPGLAFLHRLVLPDTGAAIFVLGCILVL